jgi:hypothetical protein
MSSTFLEFLVTMCKRTQGSIAYQAGSHVQKVSLLNGSRQGALQTSQLDMFPYVVEHCTQPLLPESSDRLNIFWNGRLSGGRCVRRGEGGPLLPFMKIDIKGKPWRCTECSSVAVQ